MNKHKNIKWQTKKTNKQKRKCNGFSIQESQESTCSKMVKGLEVIKKTCSIVERDTHIQTSGLMALIDETEGKN